MDAFELKVQMPKRISFRMVAYLKDGTIAEVFPSPNKVKLTSKIEALQQELNEEKRRKNQAQEDEVKRLKELETKLTAALADESNKVTDLQQVLEKERRENTQALANKESKSTAELKEKTKEITTLQELLELEKSQRKDDKTKILELENKIKEAKEKEKAKDGKEDWMNDYKGNNNSWVNFKGLNPMFNTQGYHLILKPYNGNNDDNSTNVKASKFNLTFTMDGDVYPAIAIDVQGLTNGEKAKFDPKIWGLLITPTTTYATKFT